MTPEEAERAKQSLMSWVISQDLSFEDIAVVLAWAAGSLCGTTLPEREFEPALQRVRQELEDSARSTFSHRPSVTGRQ